VSIGGPSNQACNPPAEAQSRAMLDETKNQFSLTRATLSTSGHAKNQFPSVSVAMMKASLISYMLLIALLPAGCNFRGDDSENLAYALKKGARRLRWSSRTEEVVHYQPLSGTNQNYSVKINESTSLEPPFGGALGFRSKDGGGTTYHASFVIVPKSLFIEKSNAGIEIVLRKNAGQIEVVEIR
jgi:predicted small secreted protein